MYRFKMLRELILSVMDADTDLLNLTGMLGCLDSPCLERLFLGMHVLLPSKADKNIVGITTLAGSRPLRVPFFRTKLACMHINWIIQQE